MKINALMIALSLLGVGSVLAANLPAQEGSPAPMAQKAAPHVKWAGPYVGLNGGWVGSAQSGVTNTGTDTGNGGLGTAIDVEGAIPGSIGVGYNGLVGGGQLGYNWQRRSWVLGVEGDADGASPRSDATHVYPGGNYAAQTTTYHRELDWLGTLRARAGFTPISPLLLYATGGLAFGKTKIGSEFICPDCGPPSSSETTTVNTTSYVPGGWAVGAGAEWMVKRHWTVKAEYLYADLGTHSSTIVYAYGEDTSSLTSKATEAVHIARAGFNFRF